MERIFTFSQYMNKLISDHHMTPNQLSAAIGISRAEVKRLLSTDPNETTRRLLLDRMKNKELFSSEELDLLARASQVSGTGIERYRVQLAIEHLLTDRTFSVETPMTVDSGRSLVERLAAFQNAERIEILCMDSSFSGLIQAIRPLFADPKQNIEMQHFIHLDFHANRAASFVAIVSPLLFDSRYHPYGLKHDLGNDPHPLGGNMLSIRALQNGVWNEAYFTTITSTCVHELPNANQCEMHQYLKGLLKAIRPLPIPLKESENQNEDFTSLCMTFFSHELNRASYSLVSDIAFQQIPGEIALAALRDSLHFSDDEIQKIIQSTLPLQEQRFHNLYTKKKPTYIITTYHGCEHFLRTGISADHFVGFRPFTPEERKQIFHTMLHHAQENPYYTPLLLKDPECSFRFHLGCYDKLGVTLNVRNTNYDISNGYRSVFLMYPDFTRQYMTYYLETLVPEKCFDREESIKQLERLYRTFLNEFNLKEE